MGGGEMGKRVKGKYLTRMGKRSGNKTRAMLTCCKGKRAVDRLKENVEPKKIIDKRVGNKYLTRMGKRVGNKYLTRMGKRKPEKYLTKMGNKYMTRLGRGGKNYFTRIGKSTEKSNLL
jgi:hypothetical protein